MQTHLAIAGDTATPLRWASPRLIVFVILSLALHGLLLQLFNNPSSFNHDGTMAPIRVALTGQKTGITTQIPFLDTQITQQQIITDVTPIKSMDTSVMSAKVHAPHINQPTHASWTKNEAAISETLLLPVASEAVAIPDDSTADIETTKGSMLQQDSIMQNQHARSSPAAQATDDIAPSTHAQTIANSTPIKPLSAAVSTTPTKTQKSASAAAAHKMERQRLYLIDEIHRKLTHFIEYPKRARRRGWEGEVFLAFNVSQRGTINNIHITRSSGYSLLDESAMRAMQKVRDVSWQGDDIDLQTLELELPILYQLQDG